MSDIILSIENVSKQYQLGTFGTGTIGRDVDRWFKTKVLGKEDPYLKIGVSNDRTSREKAEFVWALRDINFEVKRGEVLGIIGKNGAGKSTLLKLLSRVVSPTTGVIRSAGRMASLLEVGTGFHPELTGRENIFLNGAILGMTKAEIKRKLDEIIDFSGCALYIDTPVKRYSSGMTVRLGFAVAAFLDPEILVVDEVLAVGDFEFQRKAIGKMKEVSSQGGRTVLFVSHNMESIRALCSTGMVLQNGQSIFRGTANEAVDFYTQNEKEKLKIANHLIWKKGEELGNEDIKMIEMKVSPLSGDVISINSGIIIEYTFYNRKQDINLGSTIEIRSLKEELLVHQGQKIAYAPKSKQGVYKVTFSIAQYVLNAGQYKISLIFGENARYVLFAPRDIMGFEVSSEFEGGMNKVLPGLLYLDMKPTTEFLGGKVN
jgi:lipopolysaccharide transport system ATP-binding protein